MPLFEWQGKKRNHFYNCMCIPICIFMHAVFKKLGKYTISRLLIIFVERQQEEILGRWLWRDVHRGYYQKIQ